MIGAVLYVVATVVAPASDSSAAEQFANTPAVAGHQAVESKQAKEIHAAYLPYYDIRPTYLPYY